MSLVVYLFLSVVWGFSWVAIKLSLEGIPPFFAAALRFLLAVPFLLFYAKLIGVKCFVPRHFYRLILFTSVLIYGLDYAVVYWGEQYLSAGVTAILFATFPLFTGIISQFVFKSELPGPRIYLGLVIGFGGVFVMYYQELLRTSGGVLILLATLGIVGSAISAALAMVVAKQFMNEVHPVTLTLSQIIPGSLGLFTVALARGDVETAQWSRDAVLGILYLSTIATALAFSLYYWLLKTISAVTVATLIYVTPVTALFFDWLVFGVQINSRIVVGMLLIFTGIALAEFSKYRPHLYRTLKSFFRSSR
jgi:drug/metabolite transporter (DMT)-like permease